MKATMNDNSEMLRNELCNLMEYSIKIFDKVEQMTQKGNEIDLW